MYVNLCSFEYINVIKGEAAKEKYGDKGENGVVEIYTKGFKKSVEADELPRFGNCEDQPNANMRNACSKKASEVSKITSLCA